MKALPHSSKNVNRISGDGVRVVTAKHEYEGIGVLIVPDREALAGAGFAVEEERGVLSCPLLRSEFKRRLASRAGQTSGSSSRVTRALVMSEPPSFAESEITAKGNLNFRKILTRRADLLERLYDDRDPSVARI
jgi:feruloyl-CoA synthase